MKHSKIKIIIAFMLCFSFFSIKDARATVPVIDYSHISVTTPGFLDSLVNTGTNITLTLWEEVVEPAALALWKQLQIKFVNEVILEGFMSGMDGLPYFVTNWQDYLYMKPQDFAADFIKNEFPNMLSGSLCGTNTSPYYDYLCDEAKVAIDKIDLKTTLPQYMSAGSDPRENLFSDGSLRAFNGYFECANNPYCLDMKTDELFRQVTAQKKEVAVEEASGDGTLPIKGAGGIKTPGSIIANAVNDSLTMGNGVLVNATTAEELMVSVFTTMLNNAISTGFNNATAAVNELDFTKYGL